ncbi:MAG: type II toxin-antitoxin system RelE family toxin [Thermoguttaceae bacterium]
MDSLKEWNKLDSETRLQFANILERRLENPPVASAALHGMDNCYKIKLRSRGCRLVYQVIDETICVVVIAVGRRDKMPYMKRQTSDSDESPT